MANSLSRRHFLGLAGTAVLSGPLLRTGFSPPRRTSDFDPSVIDELIDVREALVNSDSMLGARPLVASVSDQVARIEGLVRDAPPAHRSRLFQVGAMFAEFAGWLADDLGDVLAGQIWSGRAFEWAHAADDPAVLAYVLMRRSQQAALIGDAATAVALAGSVRPEGVPRRVLAAAAQQAAHGHALDGDEAATLAALDQAYRLLDSPPEAAGPFDLAGFCTPAYVHAQRGACMVRLGQPGAAVEAFDDALATWAPTYRRERGLHLARKATAWAAAGEPTEAARTGRESLAVVRLAGSARTVAELRIASELLADVDSHDDELAAFRHELADAQPA